MPAKVDYTNRTVVLDGNVYRIEARPDGVYGILDAKGHDVGWARVAPAGTSWTGAVVERVIMAWVGHCVINDLDPWLDAPS